MFSFHFSLSRKSSYISHAIQRIFIFIFFWCTDVVIGLWLPTNFWWLCWYRHRCTWNRVDRQARVPNRRSIDRVRFSELCCRTKLVVHNRWQWPQTPNGHALQPKWPILCPVVVTEMRSPLAIPLIIPNSNHVRLSIISSGHHQLPIVLVRSAKCCEYLNYSKRKKPNSVEVLSICMREIHTIAGGAMRHSFAASNGVTAVLLTETDAWVLKRLTFDNRADTKWKNGIKIISFCIRWLCNLWCFGFIA